MSAVQTAGYSRLTAIGARASVALSGMDRNSTRRTLHARSRPACAPIYAWHLTAPAIACRPNRPGSPALRHRAPSTGIRRTPRRKVAPTPGRVAARSSHAQDASGRLDRHDPAVGGPRAKSRADRRRRRDRPPRRLLADSGISRATTAGSSRANPAHCGPGCDCLIVYTVDGPPDMPVLRRLVERGFSAMLNRSLPSRPGGRHRDHGQRWRWLSGGTAPGTARLSTHRLMSAPTTSTPRASSSAWPAPLGPRAVWTAVRCGPGLHAGPPPARLAAARTRQELHNDRVLCTYLDRPDRPEAIFVCNDYVPSRWWG